MKKLFLSLIALFFAVHTVAAQSNLWSRRNISMLDGLPTNTVRSITQDKDGFIWMGTDNGLCRYDGYNVLPYHNRQLGSDQYVSAMVPYDRNLLVGSTHGAFLFDVSTGRFNQLDRSLNSLVNAFAVDVDGNAWVATRGQGIYCYHPSTKHADHYPMRKANGILDDVFADNTNQVWAFSKALGRIYHFNKARKAFDVVPVSGFTKDIDGMRMAQGPEGSVLLATWTHGLLQLFRDGRVTQLIPPVVNGLHLHIRTVYNDVSNHVYLGCEEGLIDYNIQTRITTVVTGNGNAPTSERFVYAVTRDREGGLWMGTFYGGVTYFSPMGERFTTFTSDNPLLKGSVVSRFCESSGKVWIATDDGGLSCFDMHRNAFTSFPGREALMSLNVHGLWAEDNSLWIGTYGNGLIRLNTATGATKSYVIDGKQKSGNCYAVMRDCRGRLWATSMENVSLYDPATDAFRIVRRFNSLTVDIQEDHAGNMWFATQGAGLWMLSSKGQWRQYVCSAHASSIGSNDVNCVREGFGGRLYVATSNGLYEYLPANDAFKRVSVESSDQCFMGLVFNDDELWLSSVTGLIKLVPGGPTEIYNRYDGLLAGPSRPNACMMASDGRVWMGSVNGINTFYPYEIKENKNEPRVFITSFYLPHHDQATLDSLSGILSHTQEIELSASENMFTIQFSALSFVSPQKNRYQYMLKGFDDKWIEAGTEHKAIFTNIPPGSYTFLVRACNNDGVWASQPAQLTIVVHPPFYWSLPAKVFYLALFVFLVWWIIQRKSRKAERRHQREIKEMNERKEKEMSEARLHFFTMIAHEIRTPVTLIIGPLEKLKEQMQTLGQKGLDSHARGSHSATQTLDVIDRNAHRLLDLVNQLLDYNKVKQQGMKLHFTVCNIAQLMRAVAVRFEPTLQQKGITFEVSYPDDSFTAVVDGEAVTKILSNFMTNAAKYAKSTIRMTCGNISGDTFQLSVSDDGIGISKEEQGHIFDAFYQAKDNKPGTGIGLNTVKMLTEAHHGMVEVKSAEGEGAVFTVTLPVKQDVAVAEESEEPLAVKQEEPTSLSPDEDEVVSGTAAKEAKPVMLVVDDDDDMRNFIASNFQDAYMVLTAADGNEGLQRLRQTHVSIIVSDWMMPNMDGAEFCRRVRQDSNTSHIPFIMLTAKTDDASKAESMDCGADAFIEKPFSMQYLEACIRNMIAMRRRLMQHFAATPTEPVPELAKAQMDNALLRQMNEIIEENIDNPDFNVQMLAERLNISRSGLFAKVKAITDITPNEMIQIVRLRKAARLLKTKQYRVSEVAYQVGFNNPSYFSKCFQNQFGVKPGEY